MHRGSRAAPSTFKLPITDKLKQQNGFVHGGVLSYLADNALTFAGGTAMAVPVVTAEFKINYVRPAIRRAPGCARQGGARRQHAGRLHLQKSSSCGMARRKLCALAQGTIARLPDPSQKST